MRNFSASNTQDVVPAEPVSWVWRAFLLCLWGIAGFGTLFFAADLGQITVGNWSLGYWLAAQGVIVFYVLITVFYAWLANKREQQLQQAQLQQGSTE